MLGAQTWLDRLREVLIYAGVLLGPWMFGTTQSWSIWTMNAIGYSLGFLTLTGWLARGGSSRSTPVIRRSPSGRVFGAALGCLSLLVLAGILVSFLNAAADYDSRTGVFGYRARHVPWLPATFNAGTTLACFWNYAALACFFWATVDWLGARPPEHASKRFVFAPRFRRLLWVLAINGAMLAAEGIIQRLEGSGKLLFLVKPRVNPGAETQFGPYAYRANASQYLNLIWPVVIGFWLSLHRAIERGAGIYRRGGRQFHHTLVPLALVMAVAPLVSTSRGGALVLMLNAAAVVVVIWLAFRGGEWPMRWGVPIVLAAGIAFGAQLGWKRLSPRMETIGEAFASREQMYETAAKIARDYPVYGTGAGSLDAVFQLYRSSPEEYWPVQLHNDWLETLITFGWVGATMVWLALALVLARWFFSGEIRGGPYFVACVWIAMGGCLLHARWDFPFQIYSIVHLFLTLGAMLFCLARKTG